MSGITISQSVRSNLLNLQQTSDLIAQTQNRLSTGRKVSSALDNPSNFFTAQSLNSRANDLGSLLDGLSNGIKTIQAADNGLKAITRTVETLQSTVRQARQDKSFQTETFSLGSGNNLSLSFSGGAVGSTPVSVGVSGGQAAQATSLTGDSGDYATFGGGTISVNGVDVNLSPDVPTVASVTTASGGADLSGGNADLSGLDGNTVTITADDGTEVSYTFSNAASGQQGDALTKNTLLGELNEGGFAVTGINGGISVTRADGQDFTITVTDGNGDAAPGALGTLGYGDGSTTESVSSTDGTAGFTAGTVGFDANAASLATEINAALDAAGQTSVRARDDGNGELELIDSEGKDITLSSDDADLLADLGFGSGNVNSIVSTNGTEATGTPTVDDLVREINNNDDLKGKVRASNVNGQLRVENLSTSELTIEGINNGSIDGSTSQATVGGNSVRNNLADQFNELREQLDRLADDAGFNGINLLRGDRLRLSFNENGSSSIDIQARDSEGNAQSVSARDLGIGSVTAKDFESDAEIEKVLGSLDNALSEIRAQSSAFGANLSSVQNRQDFTRETINTLRTGADNLTLADINEEAANLLSLQTRQQLSNTSLSLANQADQGVLRLF